MSAHHLVSLAQRASVRQAAAGLARALLSEAGVKPGELDEARDAALVSQAGGQLVTPRQQAHHGARKAQIFGALREAGPSGMCIRALMALTDKTLRSLHGSMYLYEQAGHVWRRRIHGALHYVLTEVQAPIEGEVIRKAGWEAPPPKPAKRTRAPRQVKLKMTAAQLGLVENLAATNPGAKATPQRLARETPAVVPPNVKRTLCPTKNHDPRYQIDADAFQGGELMDEWRAKRGGGS